MKTIRNFLTVSSLAGFFCILCTTNVIAQFWEFQNDRDFTSGVHFVDSNTGWASGFRDGSEYIGYVLHTSNGGETWTIQEEVTGIIIQSVHFSDHNNGWISGNEGMIKNTTDGGLNWSNQESNIESSLLQIYFHNQNIGWAIGMWGRILHTNDGGGTWQEQEHDLSGTNVNLQSMSFIDANTGWIVGSNGTILHTSDGGVNWSQLDIGTDIYLQGVHFINNTGWVVGNEGNIFYTNDGGATWTEQNSGTEQGLNEVTFVNDTIGWVVGSLGTINGRILYTEDGGQNWEEQYFDQDGAMVFVYFLDLRRGWAVGSRKIMHYYNPDAPVNTIIEKTNIATHAKLGQNQPNPFETTTRIPVNLTESGHVVLEVIDISGRKIKTLTNEHLSTGEHAFTFDAASHQSGIYLYRLITPQGVQVKRMMVQ